MTLIAIGQFCARSNVKENAKICKNLILEASKNGAKVCIYLYFDAIMFSKYMFQAIFLPEASDFIAQGDDYKSLSEPVNKFSTFLKPLVEAANTCNIFVSVGLHESGASNDRCFNTQVLIDNDGDILSKYRKVHLFNVLNLGPDNKSVLESRSTEHGNEFVKPTSTPFGNIGMLTCYDIRFPEASLWLRSQGSDIITYPSSFTVNTGKAHWETLLRARAIETQTYVIAAAQVLV